MASDLTPEEAARSGEPEGVASLREDIRNWPSLTPNESVPMAHIDTIGYAYGKAKEEIDHLTTQLAAASADNAFARAEWAEWEKRACELERARKALAQRLAEVERERDDARVERDVLVDEYERALRIEPRGWAHAAGHIYNAIVNAQFEANWKQSEKLRADRDALVAKLKQLPTWDHDPMGANDGYSTRGIMLESGFPLSHDKRGQWVHVDDLTGILNHTAGGGA